MQASVSLQPVAAVPVSASLNKLLCTIDIFLDEQLVVEEQSYPDDGQNDVDLGAQNAGLLEQLLKLLQCLVLVANLCVELGTLSLRICDLCVTCLLYTSDAADEMD